MPTDPNDVLPGLPVPQEPKPLSDRPLRDELAETINKFIDYAHCDTAAADAIMQLLQERGHYLPGAPPAARILADAKSFAERLTLSNLALRIMAMLQGLTVETPETVPAKQWLLDYLDGKNHGPAGAPMLWPTRLPGLAYVLGQWGFEPTPTTPSWVARSLPHPAM